MSQKIDAVVASTIGIDTGKNTLHLIGLDDQGAIVLREKLSPSNQDQARECAALLDRHRSWYGHALCSPRADLARS